MRGSGQRSAECSTRRTESGGAQQRCCRTHRGEGPLSHNSASLTGEAKPQLTRASQWLVRGATADAATEHRKRQTSGAEARAWKSKVTTAEMTAARACSGSSKRRRHAQSSEGKHINTSNVPPPGEQSSGGGSFCGVSLSQAGESAPRWLPSASRAGSPHPKRGSWPAD